MNISTKLENLTLSETRKCPRCGVIKNILEDFHKGASACKECRKADYSEKKEPSVKKSDLVELVKELALKVEKMERAFKRRSFDLSDDEEFEEQLKKSEKRQKPAMEELNQSENSQKPAKEKLKQSELEKKTKSKSEVFTDSDEEVVKKPKSKLKSKPNVETREVVKKPIPKMPDSIAEVLRNKSKDKRRK